MVDHAAYNPRRTENSSRRLSGVGGVAGGVDTVRVVLLADAGTEPAAVADCCERIRSLLAASPGAVVECDVGRLSGSAEEVLRVLTRVRLVTRSCGGRLTLHHAGPALLTVIDLFGLSDLFPTGNE